MTREEYLELNRKIVALYQARVDEYAREMESEKQKDLDAAARIWRLEHDGDAPPPPSIRQPAKAATNGDKPASQKQKIRKLIDGLAGPLNSAKIIRHYGMAFVGEPLPDTSTISKVFREMEKNGELRKTKEAGFQQPAEYVRT